jgi:hypothetical protein
MQEGPKTAAPQRDSGECCKSFSFLLRVAAAAGSKVVLIHLIVHKHYKFVHNLNVMATSIPLTLRNSLHAVVGPTAS